MTHTNTKGQGQRSLGSKLETYGRKEETALPLVLTRSVKRALHEDPRKYVGMLGESESVWRRGMLA